MVMLIMWVDAVWTCMQYRRFGKIHRLHSILQHPGVFSSSFFFCRHITRLSQFNYTFYAVLTCLQLLITEVSFFCAIRF